MKVINTNIEGLLILKPDIFYDNRGYFFESYNKKLFSSIGIDTAFVQDNQSFSKKNVIRGLHFQVSPYSQAKLVRVIIGKVMDVAVDIRKNSKTYGQYVAIVLSGENNLQFFIPEDFAHGFVALEDNTVFEYKCSSFYNKESERCIIYNDPDLNIEWGIEEPVINDKDLQGMLFKDLNA